MANQMGPEQAEKVYEQLCAALDRKEIPYDKSEEDLTAIIEIPGEDFPIKIILRVDEDDMALLVFSPLPFRMSEEKRMEGAIAACAVTNKLTDGGFDYNLPDGSIVFRAGACYAGCTLGEDLFHRMIALAYGVVEEYNDKFFALNKGYINVNEFLKD